MSHQRPVSVPTVTARSKSGCDDGLGDWTAPVMTKALVILLTALIAFSVASTAEAAFNLRTGVSKSNVHKTGWDDEDGEESENCGDNEDDDRGLSTERRLPLRIETAPKPGVVSANAPASPIRHALRILTAVHRASKRLHPRISNARNTLLL